MISLFLKKFIVNIDFFVKWQGTEQTVFSRFAGYRAIFFGKYFRPKAVAPGEGGPLHTRTTRGGFSGWHLQRERMRERERKEKEKRAEGSRER